MSQIQNTLFNKRYLAEKVAKKTLLELSGKRDLQEVFENINSWISLIDNSVIQSGNEKSLQRSFLQDIFNSVLGYKKINDSEYNLLDEKKTEFGSRFPDAAIGFFSNNKDEIHAVVELKKYGTNLDEKQPRERNLTPVEQAFDYANKNNELCKWIVVSNLDEFRLYSKNTGQGKYEQFFVSKLKDETELKKFIYLLSKERLISDTGKSETELLLENNHQKQKEIENNFYKEYKQSRHKIFEYLKENNKEFNEIILLEKTQKLLDRIIFICFCEDTEEQLLPKETLKRIIENAQNRFNFGDRSLWTHLKGLFNAINNGSSANIINKYNGGLFAEDEVLDKKLLISDDIIKKDILELADYFFGSDLDVNILGHIFEQSISDIEEIKAGIKGEKTQKKNGKRTKDGVFYTPPFITHYIVDKALGNWLEDRKNEIGIYEVEIDESIELLAKKKKRTKDEQQKINLLMSRWEKYKTVLSDVKVLDPACGSGAFLNAAFDFLYREGLLVNEKLAILSGNRNQVVVFSLDKSILQNNLFGVDINFESVEITKLSLWIKTANINSELAGLDQNIKHGNSLIEDSKIAGELAFDWNKEFPEIMKKGGFDVVVGNPPWGAKLDTEHLEYINGFFKDIISGEVETYLTFLVKSIYLTKSGGYTGLIIPDTWLTINKAEKIRGFLRDNCIFQEIFDRYKPFDDAKDTRCHTVVLRKDKPGNEYFLDVKVSSASGVIIKDFSASSNRLNNAKEWNLYVSNDELEIFEKMKNQSKRLEEIVSVKYGLRTGDNSKYLSKESNPINIKVAKGSSIERYVFNWDGEYLISKEDLQASYFSPECLKEKVIIQYVRTNSTDSESRWLEASYIKDKGFIALNSTTFLYSDTPVKLKYVLALINSKLMNAFYKAHYTDVNVKPEYLKKLPIPEIEADLMETFSKRVDQIIELNDLLSKEVKTFVSTVSKRKNLKKVTEKITNFYLLEYVGFIDELKKQKVEISLKEDAAWNEFFNESKIKASSLKQRILLADEKIDNLVYKLYELTPEEIRIVEGK